MLFFIELEHNFDSSITESPLLGACWLRKVWVKTGNFHAMGQKFPVSGPPTLLTNVLNMLQKLRIISFKYFNKIT
jgi:hypothetical protein